VAEAVDDALIVKNVVRDNEVGDEWADGHVFS
jgi:hypothetical protein